VTSISAATNIRNIRCGSKLASQSQRPSPQVWEAATRASLERPDAAIMPVFCPTEQLCSNAEMKSLRASEGTCSPQGRNRGIAVTVHSITCSSGAKPIRNSKLSIRSP